MMILKAIAVLVIDLIEYLAFGSFFGFGRNRKWPLTVMLAVGFFAYYALFAIVCLPVMFTYRPLSFLARAWTVPAAAVPVLSAVIYRRSWAAAGREAIKDIRENRGFYAAVAAVMIISVTIAVITYNFTLDAAYYVAGVATNVDTDMINVYDPFTGAWQDHFELRYAFSTYHVYDAVVCSLTRLPALIVTKTVMSALVVVIVYALYVFICRYFFKDAKSAALMYVLMAAVNLLFISSYTSPNFLATRTYEGKSVVGNISVVLVFALFMMLVREEKCDRGALYGLFATCLGTATVSSTANMVIPALVFSLFVPYAFMRRRYSLLAKAALCVIPELAMMLVYVLYVKGYFAIYTFPR